MSKAGVGAAGVDESTGRKGQLAAIGADMFGEYGYHSAGLGDIARTAGITGPAIYRHFSGKQAILAYAAREFTATLIEHADRAARGSGPAATRLDTAVRGVVRLVVTRRRSVRLYQWERRHLEPNEQAELTRAIATLISTMSTLLAEARPELPAHSARVLSCATLSSIAGLSTHRVPAGNRTCERVLRQQAAALLATDLPPRTHPTGELARAVPPDAPYASRRERLLAAALRPFRVNGFHGASMEVLGHAAGIGASSVYRHFAGKADLLAAVYYRAADRLSAATATATAGALSPHAALEQLVHAYVSFTFDNPDLVAVYLAEYENLPSADRHALRRVQREHVEQWVRILTACRDTSRPTADRLAVHAALNVVHDLAMIGPRLAEPAQAEHLVRTVLEPSTLRE